MVQFLSRTTLDLTDLSDEGHGEAHDRSGEEGYVQGHLLRRPWLSCSQ